MSFTMIMDALEQIIDFTFSQIPYRQPSPRELQSTKLIAHRGTCPDYKENTLQAFSSCMDTNIFAIEFDVHATKDHVPVIAHDPDCNRVFSRPDIKIHETNFKDLRSALPEIPTLEEVIAANSSTAHLMIELKVEFPPGSQAHLNLKKQLSALEPCKDFHVMSLECRLFDGLDFLPSRTFLPVAILNTSQMSREALRRNYAGVSGPYSLLSQSIINRHHDAGQMVGTGFINSKNLLFREINRKVDWLFSNNSIAMKTQIDLCQGSQNLTC